MKRNGPNTRSALPDKDLFRIGEVSRLTCYQAVCLAVLGVGIPDAAAGKEPEGTSTCIAVRTSKLSS